MKKLLNLNKKIHTIFLFILLVSILINAGERPRVRPADWAQPVIGTSLQNFYKVDSLLFRSAQPDKDDFFTLKAYGVAEILNLRSYKSDNSKAKDTGLLLHRVEMSASSIQLPQIIEALKIIKKAKGPLLVHCRHGSDRTGVVIAMYRIVFQNWTKEKAIDEMVNGGYGFHKMYDGIIEFIKNADVEEIRKSVNK